MRIPTLIFAAAVFSTAAHAQSPSEAIDRYMRHVVEHGDVSGTLLVARGDSILFHSAYGFSDAARTIANQISTPYPIASPTKPLTGMLIRRLARDAVLSLSDSISKWLPDFPRGGEITIEHLLSHRSGIPHRVTTFADEQRSQTPESMVRLIAKAALAFTPGERRMYSSAGYAVLAWVAELATGESYANMMRRYVMSPAGITQSFDATEQSPLKTVKGFFATSSTPLPAADRDLSFLVGGGSLYSTPLDLFRIVRTIRSGAYGPVTEGAVTQTGAIQWNGFTNGFRAFVDSDPGTQLTVVFAGNVLTGAVDLLRRDVPRIAAGEQVELPAIPSITPHALPAAERARLEGTYLFGGLRLELRFLSDSEALLGTDYLLIAVGPESFFAPADYGVLTVTRSNGDVAGFQYTHGVTSFAIPRVPVNR